jgi:hypothetical protein
MQGIITKWAASGAVVVVALLSIAAGSASAQPVAHAAGSCNIARYYHSLGPTYAERLSVTGTSCASGVSLIKAYFKCGIKAGGVRGTCHSTVLGFRCTDQRSTGADQYIAKVNCKKARESATFYYSENT